MAPELKQECIVPGLGMVSYVSAPFNVAVNLIKKDGSDIISAQDLAYARVQSSKNELIPSSIYTNGSYVKEGVVYNHDNGEIVLTRKSTVLLHPDKAVKAHDKGGESLITGKQAKKIYEMIDKNSDSVFVLKNLKNVPFKRFGEDERTIWMYQDMAEEFGLWLDDKKKDGEMPFYFDGKDHIKSQKGDYENQLWVGSLDYNSILNGDILGLICNSGARGVKKVAGGDARVETYTPFQVENAIKQALKSEKLQGLENTVTKATLEILKGKK